MNAPTTHLKSHNFRTLSLTNNPLATPRTYERPNLPPKIRYSPRHFLHKIPRYCPKYIPKSPISSMKSAKYHTISPANNLIENGCTNERTNLPLEIT